MKNTLLFGLLLAGGGGIEGCMGLRPPLATQLAAARAAFPEPSPGFSPLIHDMPTVHKQGRPLVFVNGQRSSGAKLRRLASGVIDSAYTLSSQVSTALYGRKGRNGTIVFISKNYR